MIISILLFGFVIGSFLNVLICRVPAGQGVVFGRSHCPHCHATLALYDLIPLASFAILRGHCRSCRKAISFQYPLVELASGILFIFLWTQPLFLIAAELLLAIAIIDYRHFIIPDSLLIVLAIAALWEHHVFSALGAFAFFATLWLVSRGRWIGFGDAKLAGVLGLLFGFPAVGLIVYIAVLLGGLFGVTMIVLKKATMKTALPFGTLLSLCAGIYIFFNEPLIQVLRSWNLWW